MDIGRLENLPKSHSELESGKKPVNDSPEGIVRNMTYKQKD